MKLSNSINSSKKDESDARKSERQAGLRSRNLFHRAKPGRAAIGWRAFSRIVNRFSGPPCAGCSGKAALPAGRACAAQQRARGEAGRGCADLPAQQGRGGPRGTGAGFLVRPPWGAGRCSPWEAGLVRAKKSSLRRILGCRVSVGAQKRWRMDRLRLLASLPGVAATPPRKPLPPGRSCDVFLFSRCVSTALRSVRLDRA